MAAARSDRRCSAWLPKNAARCVVINQTCMAAILDGGRHRAFGRIGSAVAMSAHSQSGQTETDYYCAHGDSRSHRPLPAPWPWRSVADAAWNDAIIRRAVWSTSQLARESAHSSTILAPRINASQSHGQPQWPSRRAWL